jgi:DNA-binding transcriptional LysR family regulator
MEHTSLRRLARATALRYFFEVAESGSFRGAADAIRIAASSINRQVTNLETDLGVQLFERRRGRGGIRLTDAGKVLQLRLRSAMNELALADEEIAALQGLQRGHIRLGVNEVIASDIFPRLISNFHRKHPNISYNILVGNTPMLTSSLKSGAIDLALGFNFLPDAGLSFASTVPCRAYLIVPKSHPLAARKTISIREIAGVDFVVPHQSLMMRRLLDTALRHAEVSVNPILETNSYALLRSMVASGIGVSIIAGNISKYGDRSKSVAFVPLKEQLFGTTGLSCCALADKSLSAASIAFLSSMKELISSLGKHPI